MTDDEHGFGLGYCETCHRMRWIAALSRRVNGVPHGECTECWRRETSEILARHLSEHQPDVWPDATAEDVLKAVKEDADESNGEFTADDILGGWWDNHSVGMDHCLACNDLEDA